MKLKQSLSGLLLIFSLIPLSIFGAVSLYEMNQKIDSMLDENLTVISENQIATIEHFASERKTQMEKVASYALTQAAIQSSLESSDEFVNRKYLDDLLTEQKKHTLYVASISVIDKNFRVVASSEKYHVSETSQLKELDHKFYSGDFIMGNVYERQTDSGFKRLVPAYIGVYDGKNELIGYISEELDTAYFNELRLDMTPLSTSTFYLLDGTSTIITAGDPSNNESLSKFVTTPSQRGDFQEKWNAIDFETHPKGEVRYTYNGEKYITYYANVEYTDWTIRVTENLSDHQNGMLSYNLFTLLFLILLILGVATTNLFVTNRIVTPIETIISVFDEIKRKQDYSLRIPTRSKNEIGKMIRHINELLSYIEQENIHEKIIQQELQTQVDSDPLTGVKNKRAIEKYILEMVNLVVSSDRQITLGFLDVDDFRNFNTEYGHQVGDEVLIHVAKTMQENLNSEVGRIGGDEFVFCNLDSLAPDAIREAARKTLHELQTGYIHSGKQIPITCSLGIVTAKGDNLDYTELIRMADQAMYLAKDAGKNTFVLHEKNMER